MNDFLVRLLITIGIIWLTQFILGAVSLRPDISRIILVIVAVIMILYLLFGLTYFPIAR